MAELSSGTVTFLFTDLEGSTRLWEEGREAMAEAVARHDTLLEEAIGRYGAWSSRAWATGWLPRSERRRAQLRQP